MGYFSNSSDGDGYFSRYCAKCIHDNEAKGVHCEIWNLHLMHSYSDCNKEDSYLHVLIPRNADGGNERCVMFVDRGLLSNLALEKFDSENGGRGIHGVTTATARSA